MQEGTVAKLIAELGFKIDTSKLKQFEKSFDNLEKSVQKSSKKIKAEVTEKFDSHVYAFKKAQEKMGKIHSEAIKEDIKREKDKKLEIERIKDKEAKDDLDREKKKLKEIDKAHGEALSEKAKREKAYNTSRLASLKNAAKLSASRFSSVISTLGPQKNHDLASMASYYKEQEKQGQIADKIAAANQAAIDKAHGQALEMDKKRTLSIEKEVTREKERQESLSERIARNLGISARFSERMQYQRENLAERIRYNNERLSIQRERLEISKNRAASRGSPPHAAFGGGLLGYSLISGPHLAGAVGGFGIGYGLSQMNNLVNEINALTMSLTSITGSAGDAAKALDYLKSESNRLGFDYMQAATGYKNLLATTAKTEIGARGGQQIFSGLMSFFTAYGATEDQKGRGTTAITQMLSKKRIYAEEMTQQLKLAA